MAEESRIAPASDYDQFVDWSKRLGREEPLFRWAFAVAGANSVIDVGAGSARHSIMFARWGMRVDAVDPDESMLAQAEANIAEAADSVATSGGEIHLVTGGFGQLASLGLGPADALVCTGNALPHVEGHEGLRKTLADFAAVVRPGGVLVLHLLNHARLLDSRPRVIPPVLRDTAEGTKVFLRVIDYPVGEEFLDFDFLTLVRDPEGEWNLTHRRSPHTALPLSVLQAELAEAGFGDFETFGGHDRAPFDEQHDESIIFVARRI
jgi:SAM-dependent methyltransferase